MSKRGEATRQRILSEAVSLFAEGGFRALRISAICERSNTSPTSVYWHFKDKSGLVQAVLEAAFQPIGDSILQQEPNPSPDADAFLKSLEALVTEQPVGSLTMLAYVADDIDDPELEAAIAATRRREAKLQADIISSALGVDQESARRIGVLVNACVNYAALVQLSGGSRREVKQVLEALRSVM